MFMLLNRYKKYNASTFKTNQLLYEGFLILLLIGFKQLVAQTNLVSNGSFETYTACPTGGAQWNRCTNWNNVNSNLGIGLWGTPDYYTTCGTGNTSPPSVFSGTCNPRTGSSMMGLALFNTGIANAREYLACPLSCSMFPGNTYTVSFWLSNGTSGSPYSISNIGVCFSSGPLSQSGLGVISATPQCELTSTVFSTSWVQYTFTVSPTTVWNYLTFGSFKTDAQNNVTMARSSLGQPSGFYAYYFVDDIVVLTSSIANTVSLVSSASQPTSCFALGSATAIPSNTNVLVSYYWSPGGQTSGTVNNLASGVHTVTGSYQNSCGIGLAINTVSIQNPFTPIFSLTASAHTLCTNSTLTISANVLGGSPGPYSYAWFGTPGSSQFIVSNWVWGQHTFSATATGLNGCPVEATISILFLGSPGVLSLPIQTVCAGSAITLSASSIYAQNYIWSNSFTVPVISVSPSLSTVYTLTGSIGTCSTVSNVTVNVSPRPIPQISATNISCFAANNGSATASFTIGVPPYQISWNTFPIQTGSLVIGLGPGIYHAMVTDGLGCSSSQSFAINEPSILTLSATASPTLLCTGNTSWLNAVASGGTGPSYTYTWMNVGALSSYSVTQSASGIYIYTVQAKDGNGCSLQKTVSVEYNATPTLSVTGITTVCAAGTITISAFGAFTYQWNTGSQNSQISVTPSLTTAYTVTGTSAVGNCTSLAVHQVSIYPTPTLFVTGPAIACYGDLVTYSVTGALNYLWSSGMNGSIYGFTAGVTSNYSVTGYDAQGCQADTSFSLVVDECLGLKTFFAGNIISLGPNPVVDVLNLFGLNVYSAELIIVGIYNSNGSEMKTIESVAQSSELKIDVGELPEGLYFIKTSLYNKVYIGKFIKN